MNSLPRSPFILLLLELSPQNCWSCPTSAFTYVRSQGPSKNDTRLCSFSSDQRIAQPRVPREPPTALQTQALFSQPCYDGGSLSPYSPFCLILKTNRFCFFFFNFGQRSLNHMAFYSPCSMGSRETFTVVLGSQWWWLP